MIREYIDPIQLRESRVLLNLVKHRVLILFCVASVVVAYQDQRRVLYDDVGITLRYAARIASGDGWTYNDGDHTNGASSPLYTLMLAALRLGGLDLVLAARILGVISFTAVVVGSVHLLSKTFGQVFGTMTGVCLLSSTAFRTEALSGMESGLAVALGIAFVLSLQNKASIPAGCFLGLTVLNKLDAGLLVAGFMLVYLIPSFRFTVRILAVMTAWVMPWFIFSFFYFGNILPFSMTQKTGGTVGNPSSTHDNTWILDTFERQDNMKWVLLALLPLLAIFIRSLGKELLPKPLLVVSVWGLLHFLAFSFVDLGDPYPWYLCVVHFAVIVSAISGLAVFIRERKASVVVPLLCVVTLVLLNTGETQHSEIRNLVDLVTSGHDASQYEEFEQTRLDSGLWLNENAKPRDVVETCWGWTAYGAARQQIKESCPLSTRKDVGSPTWKIESVFPASPPFVAPQVGGCVVMKEFTSPNGATWIYECSSKQ